MQDEPSLDGIPYGVFSTESPGTTRAFDRLGFTDGEGLFVSPSMFSPGQVMARVGQTAPSSGGATFAAFPRSPDLFSSDFGTMMVAFAELSGGSAPGGVFRFFPTVPSGSPTKVALVGDVAPGTGGGSYSSFSRPSGADATYPFQGEDGAVGFAAEVSGGTASSGVFVLPEPRAIAAQLAGGALLALLRACRRRT
jgi:hypothetical protein